MEKFTSKSLKLTFCLQALLLGTSWAADSHFEFIDLDPAVSQDIQKVTLKKVISDNLDILITTQDHKEPSRYLDQYNTQQCQDYISSLPQQQQQQ